MYRVVNRFYICTAKKFATYHLRYFSNCHSNWFFYLSTQKVPLENEHDVSLRHQYRSTHFLQKWQFVGKKKAKKIATFSLQIPSKVSWTRFIAYG